jgi:SAM-dependent methyltransferase
MIESWSKGVADENMAEEILVDLAAIIRRHPWWQARAALTLGLLRRLGVVPPARVLDVGCGWGVTLDALEARGYTAVGMDISRRTLEKLDRPGRTLIEADLTQPLKHDGPGHDAVLALDVIEHIDDDHQAVRQLGTLVRAGGFVIISVPALPDMYSEFDAIQGHRRRYLPPTLREAFGDSGLRLERTFWWGRWLVPALRRQRSRTRSRPGESASEVYGRYLKLPPWPLGWVARVAFAMEQEKAIQGRLSLGTSLFAVGRRPAAE